MHRIDRFRPIFLALLILATPVVYWNLTRWWRTLLLPFLYGAPSDALLPPLARALVTEASGAALVALLVAIPFALLAKVRASLVALILGVAAAAALLPDAWFAVVGSAFADQWELVWLQLPTLAMFFGLAWLFAAAVLKISPSPSSNNSLERPPAGAGRA